MSTVNIRNPIRCFCSFLAKHTDNNIYVCGRYKSDSMVCLFHLHDENIEHYYQKGLLSLSLDCEMCLATLKIHSKEYIAPCRLTSIRCYCGDEATFYQSQRDNFNRNSYFFGCPNWRSKRCDFFSWAREYQTLRNPEILCRLMPQSISSQQSLKNVSDQDHEEIPNKLECVVCLSAEKSCLIYPCNHFCCCTECALKIGKQCPMCRGCIQSIQQIFFV
ncbi:unnamed protein product [Rotaria socialis]|uniref:RING-type domain-containing protein n=1 Tax=Rotaria socialis TaxID=392032 RepID=A0A820ZMY6_9BILA|nr:unnamed protein product [Rotaria socialis]CAF3483203.1 unnamed protein product [Rotaria socialis]CAF3553145.1 unnamed protein product [Rotaria socialis]CAF3777910.1 unnamed protein product [Rotaria socialis]CAF4384543.1 unnamed protein product [Rotaria socialis]